MRLLLIEVLIPRDEHGELAAHGAVAIPHGFELLGCDVGLSLLAQERFVVAHHLALKNRHLGFDALHEGRQVLFRSLDVRVYQAHAHAAAHLLGLSLKARKPLSSVLELFSHPLQLALLSSLLTQARLKLGTQHLELGVDPLELVGVVSDILAADRFALRLTLNLSLELTDLLALGVSILLEALDALARLVALAAQLSDRLAQLARLVLGVSRTLARLEQAPSIGAVEHPQRNGCAYQNHDQKYRHGVVHR